MNQRRWLLYSFITLLLLSQSPAVYAQNKPQKVATCVSELNSKDPKRRANAALTLGQLGQKASGGTLTTIQQSLLKACGDLDWKVRGSAYDAIKQLGSERAQPLLPKLFVGLTDRYSDVVGKADACINSIEPSVSQISDYRALLRSKHWTTRRGVAIKLAKLGPRARVAVFDLIEKVDDRYSEVERAITKAIDRIGVDASDKDKLEDLLSNSKWRSRWYGAKFLGGLGSVARSSVPKLIETTSDRYSTVEEAATDAIAKIGVDTSLIPALHKLLSSTNWKSRWYGVTLLGQLGAIARPSIPKLIELTSDRYSTVEEAATKAITQIGIDQSLIPTLNKLLSSKNWKSRWYGAKLLGQLGEIARPSIPKLIELTSDRYSTVEEASTKAIRQIGVDASLIPVLHKLLSSKNWKSRWYGVTLLGQLGAIARPSIPKLIELTSDRYSTVEEAATKAITQIGIDQSLIPTLNKLLSSKNWKSRWYGAKLLGQLGEIARPSIPKLIELTSDRYSTVEEAATKAIAKIGVDASLIPALNRLLKSADWILRYHALQSFEKLGSKARVSFLEVFECLNDRFQSIAELAATVLTKMGPDASHIEPLITKSISPKWSFRLHALKMLAYVGKGNKSVIAAGLCAVADSSRSIRQEALRLLIAVDPNGQGVVAKRFLEASEATGAKQVKLVKGLGQLGVTGKPFVVLLVNGLAAKSAPLKEAVETSVRQIGLSGADYDWILKNGQESTELWAIEELGRSTIIRAETNAILKKFAEKGSSKKVRAAAKKYSP